MRGMTPFRRLAVVASVATALGAVILAAPACGTDPVGVDECRKIEKARCESAQACGINLSQLKHADSTPATNVGACERYYDDACLHGLALSKDPGGVVVDQCVNAIINGDCGIVENPQNYPACAFLVPAAADASTDADAADQ